jgi:hypothetical protein
VIEGGEDFSAGCCNPGMSEKPAAKIGGKK